MFALVIMFSPSVTHPAYDFQFIDFYYFTIHCCGNN
jgi:hypothetical protein